MTDKGVGARLPRKEDHRFLRGRGEYVANIRLPGMLDVAFVRSPMAHARILGIRKPAGHETMVFTAADLAGVKPIRAVCALKGFKASDQPVLASGKVRHVGELVAMCVAATRAEAEDIADLVELDLEELPAVVDMLAARTDPPAFVHDEWGDNVFLESLVDDDLSSVRKDAAVTVRRTLRTARQHMSPMEGRGVVCEWNRRLDQLVMHSATQMPHINRAGLSDCLGIDQGSIRVDLARRGRRPSVTKAFCCPKRSASPGCAGSSAGRCAGSRIAASSSRRTRTAASTTTTSPSTPTRRESSSASTAKRPWIPAPTPRIRSPRVSKARRWAPSFPALTRWSATAAAPGRWPPTRRRSFPTAASRAPACASRSN